MVHVCLVTAIAKIISVYCLIVTALPYNVINNNIMYNSYYTVYIGVHILMQSHNIV